MRRIFHHATAPGAVAPFPVSLLTRACPLHPLRLLRVSGPDRLAFLQGQLTQDLREIGAGECRRYGWTNAQGRLLATGLILAWQDSLWLTVAASIADDVQKRLRMFVLRARVDIGAAELPLTGILTGAAAIRIGSADLAASADARLVCADWIAVRVPGDDGRVLLTGNADWIQAFTAPLVRATASEWALADIRAGIAGIEAATADQYIPQMLNLDLVGGVSFNKGCYTGQEIITRTRHLGRVKRRMYRLLSDRPLDIGSVIFTTGGETGKVVATAPADNCHENLAVLPIAFASGPLHADAERQVELTLAPLPYAVPVA
jgi:tRNA-modifying protein YgfZ